LSHHQDAIAPHGGELINRIATPEQREELLSKAEFLPRVQLDERAVSDVEMIAIGAFSPLTGFMNQSDYDRVVTEMRLANGLIWSIPVTLSVAEEVAAKLKEGDLIRLDNPAGRFIAVLQLTQKYRYDKIREAVNVYRTDDANHPGVKVVYNQDSVISGYYNALLILFSPHTKLIQLRHDKCFAKKAGKPLSVSKLVTPSTAPMNISKSAL
jgi:sulfate adenylyltransferase